MSGWLILGGVVVVLGGLLSSAPTLALDITGDQDAAAISTLAFQLTSASPSVTRPILIDATESFTVAVTSLAKNLTVQLTNPTGTIYQVGDPAIAAFESLIVPDPADTASLGANYVMTLNGPAPGTWTLGVTIPGGTTSPIEVLLTVLHQNDVRAVLLGGGEDYPLGTDIRFGLAAFDDSTKIMSLTASGLVFRRGDTSFTPVSVAFADDGSAADPTPGDGIYNAFANPGEAGLYQIQINVDGTSMGGPFRRTVAATFRVVSRVVHLDGGFDDRGIDLQADGLLDAIGIAPHMQVDETGDYLIQVVLAAANGHELQQTIDTSLTVGARAPEVRFHANDIRSELGVNGPYEARRVRVEKILPGDVVTADEAYSLGSTAAYTLSGLQRNAIIVTGPLTAEGEDTDSNSLFDHLHVRVGADLRTSGSYTCSARLLDRFGFEIDYFSAVSSFQSGAQLAPLAFTGEKIGAHGVDGPYEVRTFVMYGPGGSTFSASAGMTPAFLASEFESYVQAEKIISYRADRANGSAPYTVPSAASPWVDLAGTSYENAKLENFTGTLSSGWLGDGTLSFPYRLDFGNGDDVGSNRVTLPAGSVPDLQTLAPVTTAIWFKTSFDGASDRYEYLLEWLQAPGAPPGPATESRGMSIAIHQGMLNVYLNPWAAAAPLQPDTWYHVAVAKDTSDVRVYLNGVRVMTGTHSHLGIQESPLVLGASVYRWWDTPADPYADYFGGSIAQFDVFRGALGDEAMSNAFRADSALYLPQPPAPPKELAVSLRAELGAGSGPHPTPGAATPWADLAGAPNHATLVNFNGTASSGWNGNGTTTSPYRLVFDGANDVVTLPAGSVAELQTPSAQTVEVWFETGPTSTREAYLVDWLQAFGSSAGMSISIRNGHLQTFLGWDLATVQVSAVEPQSWYHFVVVKQPGEIRAYLNGNRVYQEVVPTIGVPTSEIVIGGSTWRGAGVYGDFLEGAIAQLRIWRGALSDGEVLASFRTDGYHFPNVTTVEQPAAVLSLRGLVPNPATKDLNVMFSLASAAPATLELLDVSGRRVLLRDVGRMGPGPHVVRLGEGIRVSAGIYWLRLRQGGRVLTARAAVTR